MTDELEKVLQKDYDDGWNLVLPLVNVVGQPDHVMRDEEKEGHENACLLDLMNDILNFDLFSPTYGIRFLILEV